jgi:rhodanese-related sulfurtransferase
MNKLFAAVSVVFILISSCTIGQTTNDIEIDEFKRKIFSEKYVLVDVRTAEEFIDGHIEGALNIDYFSATFSDDISKVGFEIPVLLYCRSGNRSIKAMKIMNELGFKEVYNLEGGIKGWISENNPVITE